MGRYLKMCAFWVPPKIAYSAGMWGGVKRVRVMWRRMTEKEVERVGRRAGGDVMRGPSGSEAGSIVNFEWR